jgi:hypothetical protein
MSSVPLTIQVDPETARVFSQVSSEDRRKLELLLRLRLDDLVAKPGRSLQQLMDEIGAKAAARGMTPEVLESLLHGD